MKLLSASPWPARRFRALRRHIAENAGGFVCVLDLSGTHDDRPWSSIGQWIALIVLIASAAMLADCLLSSQQDPTPLRSAHADEVIESESTPGVPTTAPPQPESQN